MHRTLYMAFSLTIQSKKFVRGGWHGNISISSIQTRKGKAFNQYILNLIILLVNARAFFHLGMDSACPFEKLC